MVPRIYGYTYDKGRADFKVCLFAIFTASMIVQECMPVRERRIHHDARLRVVGFEMVVKDSSPAVGQVGTIDDASRQTKSSMDG